MPENPMITEPEVQRLRSKAEHYGFTFETSSTKEGHLRVVVAGTKIMIAQSSAKQWCPNAIVQGNAGPNALAFIWEAGAFLRAAAEPPTKPEGAKPDAEVLDGISRQQIDTLQMLGGVIKRLDADIEAAYPEVELSNKGFGKGKLELMCKILEVLHERSSKNMPDFWSFTGMRLAHHFRKADNNELLEIPEPARAWARY